MKDFSCLREMRKSDVAMDQVSAVVTRRYEQRANYTRFFNTSYRSVAEHKQQDLENLLELLVMLWPFKDQIKPVFSGDWGYVYSNDRQLLQLISSQHYVHTYYIKEAVITRPKDTIVLRSSVYQYRSFLKERL
jgi:hypothetical protein